MFLNLLAKWKRSIVLRLTSLYGSIFAIAFLLIFWAAYREVSSHLYTTKDPWILEETQEVAGMMKKPDFTYQKMLKLMEEEAGYGGAHIIFYCLKKADGEAKIFSNKDGWEWLLNSKRHFPWRKDSLSFFETVEHNNSKDTFRTIYFPTVTGEILIVAASLKDNKKFLHYMLIWFSIIYSLSILLFWGLGFFMAKNVLRPINTMTEIANRISAKNLKDRIPERNVGDEFDQLAKTLNEMLNKIDALVSAMKEKHDILAHNLRTPISCIRVNAEVSLLRERTPQEYREVIQNCLRECERLLEIANTILEISETEVGVKLSKSDEINLTDLLEKVVEIFNEMAEEKQIKLSLEYKSRVSLLGNHKMLQQAIVNVVDNAIKYTEAGGEVIIRITKKSKYVVMVVEDTGIGIPQADLFNVFEKFYRSENALIYFGSGLGLSFTKATVEFHKGTIELQSQVSQGTVVQIKMPLAMD